MRKAIISALILVDLIVPATLLAQRRMNREDVYERGYYVSGFTGAGTFEDPRRPVGIPADLTINGNGIIEWSFEPSDDGQLALVEIATKDHQTLEDLLSNQRIQKKFIRGKDRRQDIEREFRKHKRNFSLKRRGPGRQR